MNISNKTKKLVFSLALILLWCIVAGVTANRYYASRMQNVIEEQRLITEERAADLSDSIRRNVHYLSGIPNLFSQLVQVNNATALFGADSLPSTAPYEERKKSWTQNPTLNDLSRYLAVVQTNLNIDIVYLVNAAGDAIAASNWDKPGSSIGTNFAERDFFLSNKEGKQGMQYALGKTTHIAGLYFSSPVIRDGRFMGAVVAKIDVPKLSFMTSQADAYIADEYGVIIMAHDKSLEMQALPGAAIFGEADQVKMARYQRLDFPTLTIKSWGRGEFPELFKIAGEEIPHLRASRQLSEYGLMAYVENDFEQLSSLERERLLFFLLMAFFGSALILSATGLFLYLRTVNRTKEILQDSEERLRMTLRCAPDAVFICEQDGRIVYVNDNLLGVLGYSLDELTRMTVFDLVPADWREPYRQGAEQILADNERHVFEIRLVKKDGSKIPIELNAVLLPNGRVYGSCRDITGRKAAEVKIQRLTKLYAVLNQCKETIMRCTTADELFTKVCRDVVQLGGMKMVWIGLLDQQGKRVRPVASYGDGMEYMEDIRISTDANDPCGCGPTGISIRESQPYWCQDFQHDRVTESWHERGARFGWGASAALPLQRNGVAVGTIAVYAGEDNAFDDAVRSLLVEMAMDISFALDNFAREAVRMRAEAARDEALDRLQKIASRVPGLVYQYRLRPDGSSCFPFASEAIREIYRVSPEEVREDASRVFDIIHPDDAEGAAASIQESARDLTPWHHEFRVKYDDGTVRWLLGNAVPQREADGSVLWNGFITDITERIQAEDELRIAAVAFETQEAIIITDADATILRVNHAFHDITGYCAEEVIGNNPRMFQSGRHDNAFYQAMWTELLSTGHWSGELWDKRKNGDSYLKAMTITAVYGEQRQVTNYVAVFRDIMEREQVLEQLRSTASELENANAKIEEERAQLAARVMERTSQLQYANRAKDSFLATMSHEIRTPLGGLLGMMELLSLSRLNEEQGEMLQAARNSGKSLLRIVDDILDWSKIEAHKLVLAPQAATIPEMLRNVASTYAQLASAKGILLRQQVDSKLSAAHIFDPLRLSQILNNFTSNAIKFTEQGAVEISAERVAQYDGNEEVRFCVKDSGVGIDDEHRERLFQHYEQASADTARMYGGTGLGLAICRNLAELMEGTIRVESTPGLGSTFCFTVSLPVASPAAQRDLQLRLAREDDIESKPDITPVADSKRVSVLVVDDHPVNRMLLKHQIELLGLHVEVAAYGIVALSLWQTGHFDLIITDCHMPEMDGYELARSIRDMEQHDARQRVPIIAWTANVLAEEEGRCLAAGMDDILTKPTVLSDLRAMLLKWLAKEDIPVRAIPSPEVPSIEVVQDQSSADTAVDFSLLKKIAMSHAAQVEMLQEFNFHNRSDIANLNAALKDGNPAAVARSAHRIKGASRMVGALALEGVCATIEKAAAQGDMNGARRAADTTLGATVEHLEETIDRFISER